MLLSRKTTVKLGDNEANIIGHMNYAARKLWNVCNYERHNYVPSEGSEYPNCANQKKNHKSDFWYKQLPSQTAQAVLELLDDGWNSFFALKKSGGIENPHPPKFKNDNIAITYKDGGFKHNPGSDVIRFTISRKLKAYMASAYKIHLDYIYLENDIFKRMDMIKQIKIYPPKNNEVQVIVIYEVPDAAMLSDNGRYLSIDQGVHNLMTCYDNQSGETFIVGRKYLSVDRWYRKEIARVQSQWAKTQARAGIRYPKQSKHVKRLYERKNNTLGDYLHKTTREIVDYCVDHGIHTVVIGDLAGIRKNANFHNDKANQELHALPYKKIRDMLAYKLALAGIRLIVQKECYSSQTSPLQPIVGKEYATPEKRVVRGLFVDENRSWNADAVGAYNILRLYMQAKGVKISLAPMQSTTLLKVAA